MNPRRCSIDHNCSRALGMEDLKAKRDDAIKKADQCSENGDSELSRAYYKVATVIMKRIMDEI